MTEIHEQALRADALAMCDICGGRESGAWERRATRLSADGKWTHARAGGYSATMYLCKASAVWSRIGEGIVR